jgi:hypothetical protein
MTTDTNIPNTDDLHVEFLLDLPLESLRRFLLSKKSIETISFGVLIQLLEQHPGDGSRHLIMEALQKNFSDILSSEVLNNLSKQGCFDVKEWADGLLIEAAEK